MPKHGKKYLDAAKKVDSNKLYSVAEAMKLVKETSYANFDATVDVAYNLTVVVFAEGPQADQAKAAGADFVGSDDLVEKIQGGWLDFDVVVATPMMMAKVGRLGRILGPKGLMPNPKTGTVTMDIEKAVKNVKAGQVEYRVDRQAAIHTPIGKVSFTEDQLVENFDALRDVILRARPASAKGQYIKSVAVSATFGPGIKLDPLNLD